jgi:TP901 family phage tail tape measure protein
MGPIGEIYADLSIHNKIPEGMAGITTSLAVLDQSVSAFASRTSASIGNSMNAISTASISAGNTINSTFGGDTLTVNIDKFSRSLRMAGLALTASLTAPLLVFSATSENSFMKFDDNMRRVGAATFATGQQLATLTTFAKEVGTSMGYTSVQVSDAMVTAAQAGIGINDMATAMPAILGLSRAGATDLNTSVLSLVSIIDVYKLKMGDIGHVADVVAQASNECTANITDFTYSLKYAAQTLAPMNVTLEQTSALLMEFADAGIRGTTAGTEVRKGIVSLINPTKDVISVLNAHGVSLSAVNIQQRGLIPVIQLLHDKNITLAESYQMFGERAGAGMYAVIHKGSEVLEENSTKLQNNTGYAKNMTDQMNAGLGGAVRTLTADFQNLGIAIGKNLGDLLIPLTTNLSALVVSMSKLPDSILKGVIAIGVMMAALGPLALALGSLPFLVDVLGGVGIILGAVFGTAALSIGATIAASTGIILAVGGIVAVLSYINEKTQIISKSWQLLKDIGVILWDGTKKEMASVGKQFSETVDSIKTYTNELGGVFSTILEGMGSLFDGFMTYIRGIGDEFNQTVEAAHTARNKILIDSGSTSEKMPAISENYNTQYKKTTGKDAPTTSFSDNAKYIAESKAMNGGTSNTPSGETSSIGGSELSLEYKQRLEQYQLENGPDIKATLDETIRYTVDSYGQLVQKVTTNLQTLSRDEVAAYAASAKAAGESATFKVMSDGTVQASTEQTTTVITTEAGKWAEVQAKATESGLKNLTSFTKSASGEITKSMNTSRVTILNGIKTTTDTVKNVVSDMYGKIISTTIDATKTIDDGINQTVSKSSSESGNTLKKIIESSRDALGNFKDVVTSTSTVLNNGVKTTVDNVVTNIRDMYGKIVGTTKDVTMTVDNGMNKTVKSTSSEMKNQATQLIENTKLANGQIQQVITDNIETVSGGVSKLQNVVSTNIIDVNGKIISSVKKMTDTIKEGNKTTVNSYDDIARSAQKMQSVMMRNNEVIIASWEVGAGSPNTGSNVTKPSSTPATPLKNTAKNVNLYVGNVNNYGAAINQTATKLKIMGSS